MQKRNINKIKFLTLEELAQLFKVIRSPRDRAIFLIAYRHGLRASEVGLLRVDDVDLKNCRLTIRRLKGSMPGVHRLASDELRLLRAYLKNYWRNSGPLFEGYKGQGIGRRVLDVLMKKYCRQAGIHSEKAHFHTLKHSIATHLLEVEMGIESVHDWLGHRKIENTLIYAKLTNRTLNNAAAAAMSRLPKF